MNQKTKIQSLDEKLDELIINQRISSIVFRDGRLFSVLNNYEPIFEKKPWYHFKNQEPYAYECKSCKQKLQNEDLLRHYATKHYERRPNEAKLSKKSYE